MLVNWNLLVSAVKLVSFERVTCSFVGVTCSFDAITFRFVIPKWWILQRIYTVAKIQLKRWGGGGEKLCEFPTNLFWFCILFYTNTVFVWYVVFVKNPFCHFRTFPWLLKKICKIKTNLSEIRKALPPPPPPLHLFNWISAAVYVLQYSSFWNHKAKRYGIKTKSYASLTAETNKFQLTNMLFIAF